MELIIKPTGRCNFACNFCLAGKMSSNIKHFEHVPNQLKEIIDILKPSSIIVNGGDPLLSGKDYYYELLDCYSGIIDIITNLKDFVQRPQYWKDLFRHDRIAVTTSFQFGTGRRWSNDVVYDVNMFKRTCKLFNEQIGYVPMFISVIDEENEKFALDHVYLAKELGTQCKLNPVLPLGLATKAYPKYKMVDIWLKIIELGLEQYCNADVQFYNGGCSFNTGLHCTSTIRVFWIDNNNEVHYSSCDNCCTLGDSIPLDTVCPAPVKMKLDPSTFINGRNCLKCKLCRFCNACKANREANKNDPNYCVEMHKRLDKIVKSGWLI